MDSKTKQSAVVDCLYGTATVGERGQIVIPAEARKEIGIQAGDKLLIWKHPSGEGLMIFKIEAVRDFMSRMLESLERVERDAET
jgi:AbrB family looped-hinge helix DNA binding protein